MLWTTPVDRHDSVVRRHRQQRSTDQPPPLLIRRQLRCAGHWDQPHRHAGLRRRVAAGDLLRQTRLRRRRLQTELHSSQQVRFTVDGIHRSGKCTMPQMLLPWAICQFCHIINPTRAFSIPGNSSFPPFVISCDYPRRLDDLFQSLCKLRNLVTQNNRVRSVGVTCKPQSASHHITKSSLRAYTIN